MTATQSIRLYDLFRKHFRDDADAKIMINEVVAIIDERFQTEKQNFTTVAEGKQIEFKIDLLRQEMKTGFSESESKIKTELNKLIIWMVATFIGGGGLMIVIAKTFFK